MSDRNDEMEFALPTEEWLVESFIKELSKLDGGTTLLNDSSDSRTFNKFDDCEAEGFTEYEEAISNIYTLRDILISTFKEVKSEKKAAKALEMAIKEAEKSIKTLGGEVDDFAPAHVLSGIKGEIGEEIELSNANIVISNTKKFYSLYPISSIYPKVIKGLPAIIIEIEVENDEETFSVAGAVVAKNYFSGNEILDFVRHDGANYLSVKIFNNSELIDVSKNFHIHVEEKKS